MAVNAINGTKAGWALYLQTIVGNFNHDIRLKWLQPVQTSAANQY